MPQYGQAPPVVAITKKRKRNRKRAADTIEEAPESLQSIDPTIESMGGEKNQKT